MATAIMNENGNSNSLSNNNNKQTNGKTNGSGELNSSSYDVEDPRKLIPELCNHFYHLGWASGTGGGLSIRQNGRIYCAPSGVQKERIKPEDMFVLNNEGQILERPQDPKLKCSECLSLFMVAFKLRDAGCCIHSHSIHANLVTSLHSIRNLEYQREKRLKLRQNNNQQAITNENELEKSTKCILSPNEFRISHQEMIKGIKRGSSGHSLQYNDTLIVPIIDNVLHERDLAGAMQEAVSKYTLTNAVLVRNHGVYVWGKTWKEAKSMAECYDYLFKLKLEAAKYGFDWMLEE